MKQCKKIINQGQRCSNPVVPGTEYCKQHKRSFTFRRINKNTEPDIKAEKQPPADSKIQNAMPSPPGAKTQFPKLMPDKRDILIAPKACICIRSNQKQPNESLHRCIILLSNIMPLNTYVNIKTHSNNSDILILISPEQKNQDHLSVFYDALSDISSNCNAILYIGENELFIRYRDENAPRGYDAKVSSSSEKGVYLFDIKKNIFFKQKALKDLPLQNILMTIRPQKSATLTLPETAFVTAPIPLYPLISKYLSARKLIFKVARSVFKSGKKIMVFEISLRNKTASSNQIPGFLLNGLSDLPDCQVFLQPYASPSKKILIEYGYESPCSLNHIADVFSDNQIVLLYGNTNCENFCISPAPVFLKGDTLIKGQIQSSEPIIAKPHEKTKITKLSIPLRLVHDSRSGSVTSALIIEPEECQWLMKTLYLLPEKLIQSMTVFWGQSKVIIQAKQLNMPLFPFGIPMQKMFDANLFIPLHTRMSPLLSWDSIKHALNISKDHATFLTPEFRMDCPLETWLPLSRHVISPLSNPNVTINIKQSAMPKLKWTPPVQKETSKIKKLFKTEKMKQEDLHPKTDTSTNILEMAENCLSHNDQFSAGMYFFLAGEKIKAAQCIEKAIMSDH
ncbi:hypothetical protein MHK_000895 [Candidatus Magnetomorum sp. HK-1]|nr:hypothetical protein MHK_000895 [Candidatus Magnetomorum sp. HK-1]